ncbi:MAG: DUF1631 family protein [Pseudomonadales bacterium]|nr:DUF1631 family protein [Pseudomonadales bacterium]
MQLRTDYHELIAEFLGEHFDEALAQVKDNCLMLAESSSFSLQSDYLAIIPQLKNQRDVMLADFLQKFTQINDGYPGPANQQPVADQVAELSLLNNQHLERDITVANWVNKTQIKLDDQIWPAVGRLIDMAGGDCADYSRSDIILPISPSAFGEALQASVGESDLAFRFQLVLYKAFGKAFEKHAEGFYKKINRLLDDDGIAVPVRPSAYRTTSEPVSENPEDAAVERDAAASTEAAASAAPQAGAQNRPWDAQSHMNVSQQVEQQSFQQVFNQLHQQQASAAMSQDAGQQSEADIRTQVIDDLGGQTSWSSSPVMQQVMQALVSEKVFNRMQMQASGNQSAASQEHVYAGVQTASGVSYGSIQRVAVASEQTFIADDYYTALAATQEQAIEPAKLLQRNNNLVAENEAQLFAALQDLAIDGERSDITTGDADVVDLVGLLFKYVLDDGQIPDKAKTLLSYLHTPYLKLALVDEDFFVDACHPARTLLNTLAKAATQWQQDWRIYPRIQEAVHTVLSEYERDIVIFEKVLKGFDQFESSLSQRADISEQRSQQQMQSEELREIAHTEAWIDINELIQGKRLPKVFYQFYKELWLEVMSLQYMSCAGESAEYKRLCSLAVRLINTVQTKFSKSKMTDDKARRFQTLRNDLMRDLAETLKLSGISLLEAQRYFKLMRQIQQLAFDGYPLQLMADDETQELKPVESAKPSIEEERVRAHLLTVPFGTHFEFVDAGISQKLKLAWYNPKSQRFMFVNHAGVKNRVVSLQDLAENILLGQAEEVKEEKRSFFERALESIMMTFALNKTAEPELAM